MGQLPHRRIRQAQYICEVDNSSKNIISAKTSGELSETLWAILCRTYDAAEKPHRAAENNN